MVNRTGHKSATRLRQDWLGSFYAHLSIDGKNGKFERGSHEKSVVGMNLCAHKCNMKRYLGEFIFNGIGNNRRRVRENRKKEKA